MPDAICFVLCDFGKLGTAYLETDPNKASRAHIISDLMDGQIDTDVVRIIEANPADGWSRDITEAVAGDLYDQCIRKGANPSRAAIDLMERFNLKIGRVA